MYKKKDNDIFGTSSVGYCPRIQNDLFIDPNAAFKKKAEENYEKYSMQVNQVQRLITAKSRDTSTVNEKAEFQENYHKNRKDQDMQSSIFYPPTPAKPTKQEIPESKPQKSTQEATFGRKETLNRQINNLPYNTADIKGNSSRLFDLDTRTKAKTEKSIPLAPLIPYQMQWDQHDSVKYSHINDPNKNKVEVKVQKESIYDVKESKSTYFPTDQKEEKKMQEQNLCKAGKAISRVKSQTKIPSAKQIKQPVEIKILKGWNFKLMEGLSKHCKLNNIGILKFEAGEKDQASLTIKRGERWENITDWLRKDAKLKIRVLNT